MRIAILTNRYPVHDRDDASPFVRDFCRALRSEGCTIRVLTPRYLAGERDRDPWVERFAWAKSDRVLGELVLWNPLELFKAWQAVASGRRAALDLVRRFAPDFILALWALPSGYWARAAAERLGVHYGVWCLGSDIQIWGERPFTRQVVRDVLRAADILYADGFDLAERTAELAGRTCAFLPSLRLLPEHRAQAAAPDVGGRPYFLFLGRLCPQKGVLDLLDAATRLDRGSEFAIAIAGIGNGRLDLAREIAARGVGDRCVPLGRLSPAQLGPCLGAARGVVLPSHRDSIPLVVGEAVQAGTPVLCSDLPDFKRLLERFRVGRTFPAGDPDALARALTGFRPPAEFRGERRRFLDLFSPHAAARAFLADVRGLGFGTGRVPIVGGTEAHA